MRIAAERLRDNLLEFRLDDLDRLAGCQPGAVAHAENVRVHGERLLAECGVEHDIRSLAADAGE